MLEFYTKEFKKRASKQIKEVSDMVKDILPDLLKWQMKGCYVVGDNFTASYVPLNDRNHNQIGTDVKIEKGSEKYLITSSENIIRLRHEIDNDIVETYLVKLEDDVLYTNAIFANGDDIIDVKIYEKDGRENIKVITNLDADKIKDALLDRGNLNLLEYIKSMYNYDLKNKGISRTYNK